MDTLLKFITLDKQGVSLQHISEPSQTAEAIAAITQPGQGGDSGKDQANAGIDRKLKPCKK